MKQVFTISSLVAAATGQTLLETSRDLFLQTLDDFEQQAVPTQTPFTPKCLKPNQDFRVWSELDVSRVCEGYWYEQIRSVGAPHEQNYAKCVQAMCTPIPGQENSFRFNVTL